MSGNGPERELTLQALQKKNIQIEIGNQVMRNQFGTKKAHAEKDFAINSFFSGCFSLLSAFLIFRPLYYIKSSRVLGVTCLAIAAHAMFSIKNVLKKCRKDESEAAKQVELNKSLFRLDKEGNIIVYENDENANKLVLKRDKSFSYQIGFQSLCREDVKMLAKEYYIPSSLHFMYTKTQRHSLLGRFAGFDMVGKGSTDFHGNKILINHEVLLLDEIQLNKVYSFYKANHIQNRSDLDELKIISEMCLWVSQEMGKDIDLRNQSSEMGYKSPPLFDVLSNYFYKKVPVCRHKSLLLAFMLQKAKKDGILSGNIFLDILESPGTVDKHAALTYTFSNGENCLYIDPTFNLVLNHTSSQHIHVLANESSNYCFPSVVTKGGYNFYSLSN